MAIVGSVALRSHLRFIVRESFAMFARRSFVVALAFGLAGCSQLPGGKPAHETDAESGVNRMMDDAPDSLRHRADKANSSRSSAVASDSTHATPKAASSKIAGASGAMSSTGAAVVEDYTSKASSANRPLRTASAEDAPQASAAEKPRATPQDSHSTHSRRSKRAKAPRADEIPDAADIGL
jgi:hypothetical protein